MAPGIAPAAWPDWDAPWLAPWREAGRGLTPRVQQGEPVCRVLNAAAARGAPVQFVPQADLPAGTAYEQFIWHTRSVPTRDNLHDFFNGLVWLRFPLTKRRLNELQAEAIARDGVGPVRGPLRDALTVFDENGAVLSAPPTLWEALRARQWQRLFGELRPLWQQAQLVVFGHALLEKLVSPRKSMVAHVYQAPNAIKNIANLDAWLAQAMQPEPWAAKPFAPLPVLAVPGWWPANEAPGFYEDVQVFRPPRTL